MRMLAIAEAASGAGARVELELIEGSLTEIEARRADVIGVARVSGHSPAPTETAVVVDVPVPGRVVSRYARDRLMVFDDRNTFDGQAAIVVQPSLPTWSGPAQAGTVLAGYAYAPVAKRYRALRSLRRDAKDPSDGTLPKVIVCFGGSDPEAVTWRIVPEVAASGLWHTTVVLGPDHGGPVDTLRGEIVHDPVDLSELLAGADLAVIGGGTMKFEVACLGLPAVLLAAADDQLAVGPSFAATGAAVWAGDGRTIEPQEVRRQVDALVADPVRTREISARAQEVVDGLGAERLTRALEALAVRLDH
jgi:spore coat polysaccharide biosynthesis predicted glycosyltransferase SpsG